MKIHRFVAAFAVQWCMQPSGKIQVLRFLLASTFLLYTYPTDQPTRTLVQKGCSRGKKVAVRSWTNNHLMVDPA